MLPHWRRAVAYGVLVWLVPFLVAFAIFAVKESWRSLFESIMAVTVAAVTVVASGKYFRSHPPQCVRPGLVLGVLWALISIAIDLPLMLSPPINYPVPEYFADIGLTYVMIPIITAGMAQAVCTSRPRE